MTAPIELTEKQRIEITQYKKTMLQRMHIQHPSLTIPQYAEKYIKVQSGPKTGSFSNETFPPLEEILYNAGPQSNKEHIFVMASIQTIKTMALDIIAQYYVDHSPQDQIFVSATERLGKKWRTRRFEPMMNSSGVRDRRFVGAFTENSMSRRSGETMWSVEYEGKTLDIGTSNSAASLSGDTKRIFLGDEIARWPLDVSGEGHPWQVAMGRITAFKNMGKAVGVSSPLIEGLCKMEELALTGDMRQYFATCPYCGKRQLLVRGSAENKSGLKWETKAGRLDASTIRFVCEFCNESIYEHQKIMMQQPYQDRPIRHPERKPEIPGWESSKISDADFITSYQIGSLYSPFFSWPKYVHEFLKSRGDTDKEQTFCNQRDGLPFKITGQKPDVEKVTSLRGTYLQGHAPHEVLYCTAAIDVQRGQEGWQTNDKKEKPRLELEIKGHGDGYRMFGVGYFVFDGPLDDIYSGAWYKLRTAIEEQGIFTITDAAGMKHDVKLCLIDSRDYQYSDQIYQFCREMGTLKFSPSMGFNTLKRQNKTGSADDESDRRDYDRFRRVQKNDIILYEISTYIYKVALYSRINQSINFIKEKPGEDTPPGFVGFSEDYPDDYFDMLISEEHLPKEHLFKQVKKRNEALDLTVYNMAAGEVWLYQQVVIFRNRLGMMGVPAPLLAGINVKYILNSIKSSKAKGRALTAGELRQQLKRGK